MTTESNQQKPGAQLSPLGRAVAMLPTPRFARSDNQSPGESADQLSDNELGGDAWVHPAEEQSTYA